MPSGRFFVPMEPEHRVSMARTLSPVPLSATPFRFSRKNLNGGKSIHKQLAKVQPEKREQFEQRHSRELILYDAAARYLKELKDSGEAITPKAWQLEIDQLAAGKQTDTLAMKAMREDLKAVERLRKTAEQLSRQERDRSHDRGSDR